MENAVNTIYSKHPQVRTCRLRATWQEFAFLVPKNISTCLAKQDQAGSHSLVLQLNYDKQFNQGM